MLQLNNNENYRRQICVYNGARSDSCENQILHVMVRDDHIDTEEQERMQVDSFT